MNLLAHAAVICFGVLIGSLLYIYVVVPLGLKSARLIRLLKERRK